MYNKKAKEVFLYERMNLVKGVLATKDVLATIGGVCAKHGYREDKPNLRLSMLQLKERPWVS